MAKKTIWQTLNTVLDNEANPMSIEPNNKGDHGLFDVQNTEPREIIASSKEDLETKILTAQQQKYLGDQYKKIQTDRYQQSIYYESTRYASYMDFEAMEYFPEIASALDIMAEESTVLGEDGKMLQIRSDSDRIKNILEHLFYSILDVNSNLYFWIRNVLKYGDNFVFLKSDVKRGIIKAVQLKNLEIKRVEGDWFSNDTDATKLKTKFEWKQGGLVFQNFQIAHFRLIGDDKKLPYGTSVLEKSRKIWKQLSLAEDAMMVYRISRAPERRVFKIDVGSMDPADVTEYVKKVAAQFKKTTQVNQVNGQIDLRYNTLTQDEDYFIPSRILNKSIETGIIGKGEKSKQNFDSIDMDFEYFTSNVITYKLLPESLKPFEIKDLKKSKNFCPSCSNKIENNNWKFCPNCQCKL